MGNLKNTPIYKLVSPIVIVLFLCTLIVQNSLAQHDTLRVPLQQADIYKRINGSQSTNIDSENADNIASNKTVVALIGLMALNQPAYGETYALSVLSGNLKHKIGRDVKVSIFDMYADHSFTIDKIIDSIIKDKTKVVALSLTVGTADTFKQFMFKLNQRIPKSKMPQIVLGNTLATYFPETLIRKYCRDAFVVTGEGDQAIVDIVKYLRGEIEKRNISGTGYLEGDVFVPPKRNVLDFSKISMPDRSLKRLKVLVKNKAQIFIEASRGCPWGNCLFCSSRDLLGARINGLKWRPRPIGAIIKEMKMVEKAGTTSFTFSDEDFFGVGIQGVRRIKRLAQEIISNGVKLKFRISCRSDAVYNDKDNDGERQEREEALDLLKKAGLEKIFLGIESGSRKQLLRYNKGLTPDVQRQAVNLLRKLGIEPEIGFIMFDPECTTEDILVNIAFIEDTGILHDISGLLNQLKVQVGAPIVNVLRKKDLLVSNEPDIESMCYGTRYRYPQINNLVKTISDWSSKANRVKYVLKSRIRFRLEENMPEELRLYKEYRGRFVTLELEFLKKLAALSKEQLLDEGYLNDLERRYGWKQMMIAQELLDILKQNGEMDRKGDIKDIISAYLDKMQENGAYIMRTGDIPETGGSKPILKGLLGHEYGGIVKSFKAFNQDERDIEVHGEIPANLRVDNATLNMIMNLVTTKEVSRDDAFRWARFLIRVKPVANAMLYNRPPGLINFLKECIHDPEKGKEIKDLIHTNNAFGFLYEPKDILIEKGEIDRIVNAIFEEDIPYEKEILKVRDLSEDAGLQEGVFLLKPGGTFNKNVVVDTLKRITNFGYSIAGVKVFDGRQIAKENIYHRHHDYAYRVTMEGDKYLNKKEEAAIKKIYDSREFRKEFGSPFAETPVIPAYQLLDYGLTKQDIIELWSRGYYKDLFRNGKYNGLNKIGFNKYIFPVSHPKVNNGKAFLLLNGFYVHMTELVEKPGEKTIAILIRGRKPYAAGWRKMRDEFLGDTSPLKALQGSIRRDAFIMELPVTEELEFWKNVAHYSAGPIEAMMEATIWFDMAATDTAMGRLLLQNGYTKEEIEYFIRDPIGNFNGQDINLFASTENMNSREALEWLLEYYPPYYSEADALPSIGYAEFLDLMKLHDEGKLSVETNKVASDRIKNSTTRVVDFKKLFPGNKKEYDARGRDLIKKGAVCQVIMAAGTGGRFFGYDVPERYRIRGFGVPLVINGKPRSFFEIKIANNLKVCRDTGGNIPIRFFTSRLSRESIMSYLKEHDYFGAEKDIVKSYTQGDVPRFNPTLRDLKVQYPSKSMDEIEGYIGQNGRERGLFRMASGDISRKTPGHLDVFNNLVLSGELLDLMEKGVEYLHISADSNIGAVIDPELIGYLDMSGKDMLSIMVNKNHTFKIKDRDKKEKYTVMTREGKVVFSDLPEGVEAILEGDRVTVIRGSSSRTSEFNLDITEELEKGGTLVDLDGKPIILEGFRFPSDFDQNSIPYFWSAHFIVSTKALLMRYGLTLDEYRKISSEHLRKKVSNVSSRVGTYIEIKDVLDENSGTKKKTAQLTRLAGEMSGLLDTAYVLIDRDGVETGCGFLPYKSKSDIDAFEDVAKEMLKDRVLLTGNSIITIDGPSASGKTSVAKIVAKKIGGIWLEYSALYRAAALIVLRDNIPLNDRQAIINAVNGRDIEIRFKKNGQWSVFIDGVDVMRDIYPPKPFSKLTMTVPDIADILEIRKQMIPIMKDAVAKAFLRKEKVVVSGHVVGKEVFPDADLKVSLEAPLEERATRFDTGNVEEIQKLIDIKDKKDTVRKISPFGATEDAFVVDTTDVSARETADKIIKYFKANRHLETVISYDEDIAEMVMQKSIEYHADATSL